MGPGFLWKKGVLGRGFFWFLQRGFGLGYWERGSDLCVEERSGNIQRPNHPGQPFSQVLSSNLLLYRVDQLDLNTFIRGVFHGFGLEAEI